MQFPDSPRVIYHKNPLVGVTCQLNFPAILRINTEVPAEFQEQLRHQYPVLQQNSGVELSIDLPPQIANLANLPMRMGNKTYQFIDDTAPDQGTWAISLSQDALSLSTSKYVRWEEFKERLVHPLQALVDVYAPAFFTRIGLRYQNVICRSALGVEHIPWKELLHPHIAGMLSAVDDETNVEHNQARMVVKLDDHRRVLLQHGFVQTTDTDERCYLIDNDFYTEKRTEASNARTILDSLNQDSGRLFRWCITDQLHGALEPSPAD